MISRVKELLGIDDAAPVASGRLVTAPGPPTAPFDPAGGADSAAPAQVDAGTLSAIHAAVNAAVPGIVAAALEQHTGAVLRERLREAIAAEVGEAIRPAVEQTIRQVLLDEAGRLSEIVHDTAERLVREEIARIRGRRA